MTTTLSIQEVNGFPVLVCQGEERREVYEMQNPAFEGMTAVTLSIVSEGVFDAIQEFRRWFGGDAGQA